MHATRREQVPPNFRRYPKRIVRDCPFADHGCAVRLDTDQALEHHLDNSVRNHLDMLRYSLDQTRAHLSSKMDGMVYDRNDLQATEMAVVDFKTRELIDGTHSHHVDSILEKTNMIEKSQHQLQSQIDILESKLEELKNLRRIAEYNMNVKEEIVADLKALLRQFEERVNNRLTRLEESKSVASQMISSLNRLGFNFESFALSRKISWVVECKDLLESLGNDTESGCLPSSSTSSTVSLRSPVVTIPCDKVGDYDCYLNLVSNEEGFLFLEVHCIGPRYPVFLYGSILSIHGVKSLRLKKSDIALGRKDPCEVMLFSQAEAKKKITSNYLDIQFEIRATVVDPSRTLSGDSDEEGAHIPSSKANPPSGLTAAVIGRRVVSQDDQDDGQDYAYGARPPVPALPINISDESVHRTPEALL